MAGLAGLAARSSLERLAEWLWSFQLGKLAARLAAELAAGLGAVPVETGRTKPWLQAVSSGSQFKGPRSWPKHKPKPQTQPIHHVALLRAAHCPATLAAGEAWLS